MKGGTNTRRDKQKKNGRLTFNHIYKYVIINGSDTPIKKQKIARMGKKAKLNYMLVYKKSTIQTQWTVNGWKTMLE